MGLPIEAIIRTLAELEGEARTITIAHRLATVCNADQVVYLRDGGIVDKGTFERVRSYVRDFDRATSLLSR